MWKITPTDKFICVLQSFYVYLIGRNILIYSTPTPRCASLDKYWPSSMIQVLHRAVYYTHLPVNLCHWPRTDPPLQSGAESQGVYLVWSRYTYHQQPVVAYKHIVTKTLINITMLCASMALHIYQYAGYYNNWTQFFMTAVYCSYPLSLFKVPG